jgi:mono/diheme cytochrome c family protein
VSFAGALGFAGGNGAVSFGGLVNGPPQPLTFQLGRGKTQSAPRRLALSGNGRVLVASNFLTDSVTVFDSDHVEDPGANIPLGGPEASAARRGEVLFHSDRLTAGGGFTCASCHPGGGEDGRVWEMPGDGLGPRRTKSLLGVRDHAPYGWGGDSPALADRVRKTLATLHKYTPTDAEVGDLVAYLDSLPPPDTVEVAERNRIRVERGRDLFAGKARCASCHRSDSLQDGGVHDVGTGGWFRTPSLRGVGRRHPLLHNGRAWSVIEVFDHANNPGFGHGRVHDLCREEWEDLVAYLLTL